MKLYIKGFLVGLFLLSAFNVSAAYNANIASTVIWVKIYNNDTIYFSLANQPTTNCTQPYFSLDSTILTTAQLNRYYSMLLTAKTSGAVVSIGYDNTGVDCFANAARIHAISLE